MFDFLKKCEAEHIGLTIFAIAWFGFGIYFLFGYLERPTVIRYNCDLAEISPDFPEQVKEQCRELKRGRV